MFSAHSPAFGHLLIPNLALLTPLVAIVARHVGKAYGDRQRHQTLRENARAVLPIPPDLLAEPHDRDWQRAQRDQANPNRMPLPGVIHVGAGLGLMGMFAAMSPDAWLRPRGPIPLCLGFGFMALRAFERQQQHGPWHLAQTLGSACKRPCWRVAEGRMHVLLLPMSGPGNSAITPIRVPLRHGLLGLRLGLAKPAVARQIARCSTLDELRTRFVMGYGADWIDRPAFEPLGFRVVNGSSYTGLFDRLRAGRFDYLPRGIDEVWAEADHPTLGRGLVVVPRLALKYPLDDYLWVRRGDGKPERLPPAQGRLVWRLVQAVSLAGLVANVLLALMMIRLEQLSIQRRASSAARLSVEAVRVPMGAALWNI